MLRWVKNVWFNEIRQSKYQRNGELFSRQFYDVTDLNLSSGLPTDSQVITKEFYQELFKTIDGYNSGHQCSVDPKVLRRFVELVDEGYTYPEMCEEMGMSAQRLHYYKKKLQKLIRQMEIRNPFHGNRAKPIEVVSLKVYEKKYKDDYVCDFEREWCDENETTMLVVHKDREEYILVKKGKD